MSHWHEWTQQVVVLVRHVEMSNGARPVKITYKRCKQCGMVLL